MLTKERKTKRHSSFMKNARADVLDRYPETIYHNLVDQLPAVTYISALDLSSSTLYVSPQIEQMFGFAPEEWLHDPDLWVKQLHPEDRERVLSELSRCQANEKPFQCEYRMVARDGHVVWVSDKASLIRNDDGIPLVLQGLMLDISRHRNMEEALQSTEMRYQQTLDNMFEGCMLIGFDWNYIYLNDVAASQGHKRKEELMGHTMLEMYPGIEQTEIFARYQQCMTERTPQRLESSYTFPDGSTNWFEFRIQPATEGIFILSIDITERKKAEDAQRRLTRELRAIRSCNQTLLRALDELSLLDEICRIVCDEAGYRLAWVGYAQNDPGKAVVPMAWAGFDNGYLENIKITWDEDSERSKGPTGTAVRTGEIVYVQDFMTDPRIALWRESAVQRGYRSSIAFPLKDENKITFGALTIYSAEPNSFHPHEIKLLVQLADDLAFGITTMRNRAEQKMAKDALQESEALYRSLVNAMAEGVVFQDENGHITACNPSAERILGRSMEQMLERTSEDPGWESIHEDGTPFPGEKHPAMVTLLTGEPRHDVRMGVHQPDGRLVWISINSQPLIWPGDSRPYAVVTTFHDITDRKNAEEALRSSEERFSKIFRFSPIAIAILREADTVIVDVNETFVNDTGYSREEVIGRTMSELHLYATQEERQRILQELQKNGMLANFEFRTRNKWGRPGIAITTSISINLGGEKHFVSLIQDITERKQAEDQLRKLSRAVEQSPVSILITDTHGNIEYVNSKFAETTGYTLGEVLGQNPRFLKTNETSPEIYRHLWETITSGKEWTGEFYNKKKTGEYYWELASICPVFDAEGHITHYLGVKEDITERKRAEKELREAKERAEESDRLKSSFLCNMSHEIRTPMNAIIGFSEFLIDSHVPDERKRYFSQIIKERSYDLLRIVEDILDVSKIEVGQMKIFEEDTDVAKIMEEVYEYYRMKISKSPNDHNLGLELSVDEELKHILVKIDNQRLKQILNNLLDNALKFTPKGNIAFGCRKPSESEMLFYVKDTGIGVPADKQEIIFDRFRQAEDLLTTRQYGGTGLGLSIVKGLIGLMGGKIWLESEVNVGSTFYFTLPLKLTAEVSAEQKEMSQTHAAIWRNKLVLVVEDDESNALFLKEALSVTRMRVINAFTGKEALQILENNPGIDLILLDIRLPDMNGLDLIGVIRGLYPHMLVIAQTAYASPTDVNNCFVAGCNDYIAKPINFQQLMNTIDKAFIGHSRHQEMS